MREPEAAQALGLREAAWGYLLMDATSGAVLEAHNADAGFPPASTAKLPTMIAALGILGPTYRFTTQLLARGKLKAGVLSGDLVLAGDGDPLLTAGDLRALAIRMKDIGITRLDGRFLYASAIPVLAEVEPAQPLNAAYNQGLGGLNIEFNRVLLTRNGDAADPPFHTTPPEALTLVPSFAGTGPEQEELPVRAPGKLAALMLRRFALAEGIALPDPEAGPPPPGAVSLAQIRSQPLIEIARAGLEYSNNMVAEVAGLAASRALGSGAETLQSSADTLGIWLEGEVGGLGKFATALANHSGLSTASRVTPRQMTLILKYALERRFDGWRFDSLLTPSGARNTLRGRFRDPDTALRIWAKSGTMRYIKGLAGYLDARSGKRLIFALFVHDPVLRDRLENDPARFGARSRSASTSWRDRSDNFEAALISRWIRNY
ncbi:D-alanyl-D-alanine carboxypeptidase [Thalassospiraceae bacterium LMO-JJ14]|nr:D-alanyl-D-alanine carboxypeptidase [Thalassospiraceae bacterium LMO-JJ14]